MNSFLDVNDLSELPDLNKGLRYFEFIGGHKEFRCFICDEKTPRNQFMKKIGSLVDKCLEPIYKNNHIVVNQDASFALPGFYIVSVQKHFANMDAIDELTHLRLSFILREIRKGMREKLGIQFAHVYYEERPVESHSVHYWIVPITDIKKYPRLYKFDVKQYLDQFLFTENKDRIELFNSKMKEYIKESNLVERDNALTRALSSPPLTTKAPVTVDFNVNGLCNLNCTWCWGPDHKANEILTIDQWKEVASKLKHLGSRNITFTGGEPLLKQGLSELLEYVHDHLKLRVTLSTNGLLLKKNAASILPFVDDIGLPIDGHTSEINNIMRVGTPKHFNTVLEAIKLVQEQYPDIDLTVRSIISKRNADSVPLIGKLMIEHGINPKKLRWKLNQLTPVGVRKDDVKDKGWELTLDQFKLIVKITQKKNPEFSNISTLDTSMHEGRYFHIYPDGKTHVFTSGEDSLPQPFPVGNIWENFDEVMETLKTFDLKNNDQR